jgi:hypothetical protein
MSKGHRDTRKPSARARCLKKRRELLSTEELLFQPWFLSRRTASTIRWLVPPDYREKMHDYFDDYGCMRCGRLDVPYRSNGMCQRCGKNIYDKVRRSALRRMKERLPKRYGKEFMSKARLARRILRGFSPRVNETPRPRRIQAVQLGSPITAAFEGVIA